MTLKLLNTVLNTNAIWVEVIDDEVRYGTDDYKHSYFKMNIYKFVYLCKEWAYIKYKIIFEVHFSINSEIHIRSHGKVFFADSEQDVTIQATQWILDKHNTKG